MWSLRNSEPKGQSLEVNFGRDMFLTVGWYGKILTSVDSISWKLGKTVTQNNLWNIFY